MAKSKSYMAAYRAVLAEPGSETINVGPNEQVSWDDLTKSERGTLRHVIMMRDARGLLNKPYDFVFTANYRYRVKYNGDGSYAVVSRRRLL